MNRLKPLLLLLLALLSLQACSSYKNSALFQDAEKYKADTSDSPKVVLDLNKLKIQPYDVLRISIQSELSALEDITSEKLTGGAAPPQAGYTVNADGTVLLPEIGEIKLAGLTLKEAEDTLRSLLSKYLVKPFVDVTFYSFKITVQGEVVIPGIKALPTESANLLDAISMGGGIKETGNVSKVQVIRHTTEGIKTYFIDLTRIDAYYQPGFQLMPNDLVYVPPLKRKFLITNATALSAVAVVLNVTVTLLQAYLLLSRNNTR